MNFNSLEEIKEVGFVGFKKISELLDNISSVDELGGVYLVLNLRGDNIRFLKNGTGGFFKNRNPNVSINELKENWVDDTSVVYIGKAGGVGVSSNLRGRLKKLIDFGKGKKVGHWGGRLLWQIENNQDLVVCWKTILNKSPREVEILLLTEFENQYGKLPFANLQH